MPACRTEAPLEQRRSLPALQDSPSRGLCFKPHRLDIFADLQYMYIIAAGNEPSPEQERPCRPGD